MSHFEERADVQPRKIEFGLGGIVAAERRLAMRGEFGGIQPGGYVVGDGVIGCACRQLQAAQRFAA